MGIKGYAFDMDGVITASSMEHFQAWRTIAGNLGFELPDALEEQTKGISRMESLDVILSYGGITDKMTIRDREQLAERKNRHYISMIDKFTPDRLLPGVLELLENLRSKKIRIALASASKNGPLLLERLKISHYFDAVVNPSEIRYGKPKPDIFLAAAAKMEIEPVLCIGVEDAVSGVQAIKDAGMFAIGIGDPETLQRADVVYSDCSGIIPEKIEELHTGWLKRGKRR